MAANFRIPTPTPAPNLDKRQIYSQSNVVSIALTTIFTPPSDCTRPVLSVKSNTSLWNNWGTTSGTVSLLKENPACYPPQFILSNGYVPLYSPGACPSGFGIAAAETGLTPAVTFATCCPTNAPLDPYGFCKYGLYDTVTLITDDTHTETVDVLKYSLFVPPITVGWQSSDLNNFTPKSAPVLAANTASITSRLHHTTTTSNPSAQTTSSQQSTHSSSRSLSTGAEAGISVAAGVFALVIAGLLIWALMERKKRKRVQSVPKEWAGPLEEAASVHNHKFLAENGYTPPIKAEMDGERPIPEMSHDSELQELDGGWRGFEARIGTPR